jgi:tRNA dimethylallyltransferase
LIPLVVIVGPTAAGKSALALALSRLLPVEIVSADSRQIYRYMDIGTAKPSLVDRVTAPHHLVDIVTPDQPYTVADYQRQAGEAIAGAAARGRLPLLVGGTGLYIRAVTEGLSIPTVPPNPGIRASLESRATEQGLPALMAELEALDPSMATTIDRNNPRRVIRALEVCLVTGQPYSSQREKHSPPYRILLLGVTRDRPDLYAMIDRRIEQMISEGLAAEVQHLLDMGYDFALPAMSSIGYRQIGEFIRGEISLPLAIQRIKYATHRYARQQHTWFRLDDPAIHWLNLSTEDNDSAINRAIVLMGSFLYQSI